jgi:MFS family permease
MNGDLPTSEVICATASSGSNRDMEEARPGYEGWPVVAASATGVFFVTMVFFTFPVFLKPLADEFSWSREAISSAYAVMTLSSAVSAPLIGALIDRWGPRWICGPCLVMTGAAFASLALLTEGLWRLYALFAIIGLAAAGSSPVVYSRVIASWFDQRRGQALAIVIAGSALGAIIVPPITQALIAVAGWRTAYLILGIAIPLIGAPVVVRLVRERASSDGSARTGATAVLGEALRSRTLWTLIVVVFGTTITLNGAIVHLSALLTDRGVSPGRAALVVSVMGAASLLGRLMTGWLLDRFMATRVSFVLLVIAAVGAFVLARADSLAAGIVAAACIGFGTGGEVDVIPYLLSRYFGLAALSTLFGTAWMAFGLAGAVGPIAMGRAYDATGSYDVVLLWMAAGTLAIAALMLSLPSYSASPAPSPSRISSV